MKSCLNELDYQKYLEGDLSEKELGELQDHIGGCVPCRAELESWKKVKEALLAAEDIEVPSGLKERVMESVRKVKIQPARKSPALKGVVAAIAALALLVLAFPSSVMPLFDSLREGMVSYLSQLLYSTLWLIGLDIKTFFSFLKAAMPFLQSFTWVFASSTLLLVVGFFTLILKERAKLKAN